MRTTTLFAFVAIAITAGALECPLRRAAAAEDPTVADAARPTVPFEDRLRRELVARFLERPLKVHRPRFDGVKVPGGPSFVLATDDDGSLFATHFYDGGQAYDAMQTIEQKYHALAPDNVQFIVTFTSWRLQNFGAFYMPFANDIKGIGYQNEGPEIYDNSGESPLEGQLLMNAMDTFGIGPDAAWVFNQELGHRWGAFIRYSLDGKKSDALLGRDLQHWSYFLDTAFSPLEGNGWHDNRNGTFSTRVMGDHPLFSPLDLYLMGFVPERDVTPMTLIIPPSPMVEDGFGNSVNRGSQPEIGRRQVTVPGTSRTVSIQEIIKTEGPRSPPWDMAPREFHIGFMLLVRPGQETNKALHAQMEKRVEEAVAGWEYATGGRAHLIVESHGINPAHNAPGAACPEGFLQCDPLRSSACVSPLSGPVGAIIDGGMGKAAAPPVCAAACDNGACKTGCCLPGTDGNSYCFDRAICGADAGVSSLKAPQGGCTVATRQGTTPGGNTPFALALLGLVIASLRRGRSRRRA